jgi:hypothetical protein
VKGGGEEREGKKERKKEKERNIIKNELKMLERSLLSYLNS